MPQDTHTALLEASEKLISLCVKKGADFADSYAFHSTAISTNVRHGQQDDFEREEDLALGVRVFKGKSSACLSTSDLNDAALERIADQALSMASHVPADEFAVLPEGLPSGNLQSLEMHDENGEPDVDALTDLARAIEGAGLKGDGITNSEGADTAWSRTEIFLCNSNGFRQGYIKDYATASVSLIGGEDVHMERDYAYDQAVSFAALDKAEDIAALAAERTRARLNPRHGKTGHFPVIYDRRISSSLLRHFLASINGSRIVKGTSFLNDAMGQKILNEAISVQDNPHMDYMPKSKPFDGEGQINAPLTLADNGILQNWILDLRAAGKLGLANNARAARGLASQPSPASTNTWIENGNSTLEAMIGDIKDGFYVTELLGSSISLTTGDYSRGASGFWIENGQIAYPVSEMTIAGNLKDMFLSMLPANDLRIRYGCDTPSIFIPDMSLAAAQ